MDIAKKLHAFSLVYTRSVGSPWNTFKGVKILQIRNLACLLVTSTVLYYLIHLAAWCGYEYLLNIAVAVLAVHLASNLIHYGWEYLFRRTMSDLEGNAVLITGCDTGFGNKLARQLDAKGVTVFAGCLFSDSYNALQLKKECSDKLHIVQLDVTSDEQVKDAVESVTKLLDGKKLWAVVNNAGINTTVETEITSIKTSKNVMDINTFGTARVTQACLPLLRKSRGRVVIVASVASYFTAKGFSSYSMSKAAVFAYAEVLRAEMLRWNVSVHTIEPWIYKTNMSNPDVLQSSLEREFNQAPEEVRKQYGGEEYLKTFKFFYNLSQWTLARPESSLHEVVDCLEDAAIGEHPQLRYVPGFLGKLTTSILTFPPREAVDLIQDLVMPLKGDIEVAH